MAVTLSKYGSSINRLLCHLVGLSADTKPIGTYTDKSGKVFLLENGSSFEEMDTDKKYLYDAENQQWNLASSGGGGGGSATLIEKLITENGEYNASDDNADGYSKVTVDVAGGGSSTTSKKDVNFYDYDGTIVNSYTASEFAELSALPDNPTHEGLTAQGWNWSLADAKNYVASYGKLEIGQMYITDNGETRLYITLSEGRTSPVLDLGLNWYSKLDIDWGDGTHSTFTMVDPDYPSSNHTSERHEYNSAGNYVIRIKVVNGSFKLTTSASYVPSILGDGNHSATSPDVGYWNAIKRVEVGSNVEGINPYTFYNCSSLTSITIPNSITAIGSSAFCRCYSLTSITIPNSITAIGSSAFAECHSLTSITIPKSVTNIDIGICNDCYLLSSITIPDSIASISAQVFQNCYSLSSIIIPDSVTSIGSNAFRYCSSLQSIAIPNSVTRIDKAAFQLCKHLSTITLSDNITTIAEQMFNYCYSLSSILIPDSVTKIDTYAFQGCSSLTSIVIPSSVTSIGSIAFGNCYSLATITIDKSEGSISGSPWGAITGSPTNTQIIWAG